MYSPSCEVTLSLTLGPGELSLLSVTLGESELCPDSRRFRLAITVLLCETQCHTTLKHEGAEAGRAGRLRIGLGSDAVL